MPTLTFFTVDTLVFLVGDDDGDVGDGDERLPLAFFSPPDALLLLPVDGVGEFFPDCEPLKLLLNLSILVIYDIVIANGTPT